jgi:hypothetical protein
VPVLHRCIMQREGCQSHGLAGGDMTSRTFLSGRLPRATRIDRCSASEKGEGKVGKKMMNLGGKCKRVLFVQLVIP